MLGRNTAAGVLHNKGDAAVWQRTPARTDIAAYMALSRANIGALASAAE